jgi:hypothetical protein
MLKPLYRCILLLSITTPAWAATPDQLEDKKNSFTSSVKPFKAEYTIIHKSKKVGKGIRQLEKLDNDTYKYSYTTDIEWLIFSDIRSEDSIVHVENNYVTPTHYHFTRAGTGRDKSSEWTYNIAEKTAHNVEKNKTITLDYPKNIQDKLSYHLQHRLNLINNPEQKLFVYPVVKTSGDISNYVYQYDGEEEVMLPYGLVKTIKLKREVKEKKRTTYAWFAPELNYLLVKLHQIKGGVEQFEAQLNSVTVTE